MTNGWPTARLGEVIAPVQRSEGPLPGKTYRQIGVKLWGGGAYEREVMDGSQTKYKQLFRAEADDIIVNKIWARNGSVAVVAQALAGCYGSGEFPMFAPNRERLDPRWIHWLTKTRGFWSQCDEKSRGTSGKNRIRPEQFLDIEVPLPPLAEQRQVVGRIEKLAAQIAVTRALRGEAIEEVEVFRGSYRNDILVSSAAKFGTCPLGELSFRITKGESPEWQGFAYQEDGPLFIRSENVLWGKLDARNAVHIPNEFHKKLLRSQLQAGDVLINLVGASIGRVCSVPPMLGAANVNQAVGVISPNSERLSPEFLVHFLLSPSAQDAIHGGKVESARPNISLMDVRGLKVPTPPPPEQRRIIQLLDAALGKIDALSRVQLDTAADLESLLPAILDRAFKGELV